MNTTTSVILLVVVVVVVLLLVAALVVLGRNRARDRRRAEAIGARPAEEGDLVGDGGRRPAVSPSKHVPANGPGRARP